MGNFLVTVHAAGGHGCQRDVKDGEHVQPSCGNPQCPDCLAREFVAKLVAAGVSFSYGDYYARLEHWPGTGSQVTDDLLTLQRTNSF